MQTSVPRRGPGWARRRQSVEKSLVPHHETHAWTMKLCRPSVSFIGRPMKLLGRVTSQTLDDRPRSHRAARAHRDECCGLVASLELVEGSGDEAGAGGADRVTEGDGGAVHGDQGEVDLG